MKAAHVRVARRRFTSEFIVNADAHKNHFTAKFWPTTHREAVLDSAERYGDIGRQYCFVGRPGVGVESAWKIDCHDSCDVILNVWQQGFDRLPRLATECGICGGSDSDESVDKKRVLLT